MPKSKKPHYKMAQKESSPEGEGVPIVPPIIFSLDRSDPRRFVRPGETYEPYTTVPSRATMRFIYAVFAGVSALVILGFVMAILHG